MNIIYSYLVLKKNLVISNFPHMNVCLNYFDFKHINFEWQWDMRNIERLFLGLISDLTKNSFKSTLC